MRVAKVRMFGWIDGCLIVRIRVIFSFSKLMNIANKIENPPYCLYHIIHSVMGGLFNMWQVLCMKLLYKTTTEIYLG